MYKTIDKCRAIQINRVLLPTDVMATEAQGAVQWFLVNLLDTVYSTGHFAG